MSSLHKQFAGKLHELASYFEEVSSVVIVLVNDQMVICDTNRGFQKLFSLTANPAGRALGDFLLLGKTMPLNPGDEWRMQCNPRSGESGVLSGHVMTVAGGRIFIGEKLMPTDSGIIEQMTLLANELTNKERALTKQNRDLTALHQTLSLKVAELEAAMARVNQLEGIIPICMYCKKIRNDKNSWQQLERYLTEHSEAHFSHGICPECAEKGIL